LITIPLLLLVAPVTQIVLLALKLNGRIKLRSGIIWLSAIVLESAIALSIVEVMKEQTEPHLRCAMCYFGILYAGFLIALISTPLIALIFYLVRKFKLKSTIKEN